MTWIEENYHSRMDALDGRERVARSLALLNWSREMIARQIVSEGGEMSEEQIKWEVALRLYRGDPNVCRMIQTKLSDVFC